MKWVVRFAILMLHSTVLSQHKTQVYPHQSDYVEYAGCWVFNITCASTSIAWWLKLLYWSETTSVITGMNRFILSDCCLFCIELLLIDHYFWVHKILQYFMKLAAHTEWNSYLCVKEYILHHKTYFIQQTGNYLTELFFLGNRKRTVYV